MSESIEGKLASEYLPLLVGDSAVLAALLSLELRNASDKDAVLEGVRAWIDRALEGVYEDEKVPDDFKDRVRSRVAGIFTVAEKLTT
jgi:hypothetical protein